MKKIATIILLFILLASIINLASPYFERARAFASGFSITNPANYISEPMGLLIFGVGILGLARIGRKRLLKNKKSQGGIS
jgi:hypothetical protein